MCRTPRLNLLIVIVDYQTTGLTIGCLRPLEGEMSAAADGCVRVVVTDNTSGDDLVSRLQAAVRGQGWSD